MAAKKPKDEERPEPTLAEILERLRSVEDRLAEMERRTAEDETAGLHPSMQQQVRGRSPFIRERVRPLTTRR